MCWCTNAFHNNRGAETIVTLQLPFDTLNNNAGPITLTGGSPQVVFIQEQGSITQGN
jgi:hypothetical protein